MADQKKDKPETEKKETVTPIAAAPGDDAPEGGADEKQGATVVPIKPVVPKKRTVVGVRVSPQALQLAVNVLKIQPWEEVADFMPALIQAKPLFEDELHEYQRKMESE